MSYATRLAAASASPVYIWEHDGDEIDADEFDSVANWSAFGSDEANVDADTDDARSGAASIGWDKTGTSGASGIVETSSVSFSFLDHAFLTLMVRAPTTTAGALNFLQIRPGQDGSNLYRWRVPAAFFTEGEWYKIHLSLNVEASDFSGDFTEIGSPTPSGIVYMNIGWVGTSAAYTFTGARVDALRGHPYRISTGKITSPRADTLQGYMTVPSISPNRYDPTEGTLSSASMNAKVIERRSDDAVLADLSAYAMTGRGGTLYMGFRGDAETDTNFQPIFRGSLQNARHVGRAWELQASDNLQLLRRPFMQDASDASPVNITGNILDVFLQLALSTGNGNNNATYDTLTATRGAGISQDLIDVEDIERVRDNFMGNDTCDFTFVEPERSALDFFLREVCLAFGVVPVIRGNGKLSVKAVEEGVYPSTTMADLDNTNIISGVLPAFDLDNERVRNQVRILYDWNTTTDEFDSDTGTTHQNADSIARYGVRELVIEARGIVSATVAQRVAKRVYNYLGEGAPPIELQAFRSQATLEQGDLVNLDLARVIPDLEESTYGIAGKRAAVEVRGFNPANNRTTIHAALTSYLAGNYRLIGPSSLVADYDSATATERATYLFIADSSGFLGAANDPAHQIGPG